MDLDKVRVNGSGKAEVSLSKRRLGRRTEARLESDRFCRLSELETSYRGWTVAERRAVTHDVDQMVLRPPIGRWDGTWGENEFRSILRVK